MVPSCTDAERRQDWMLPGSGSVSPVSVRASISLCSPSKLNPAVSVLPSSLSSPFNRTAHILALPLVGLEGFPAGTMSWINVRTSLPSS